MRKQVFVLAMLAIVLALGATRAQAWSYNLEEFTITSHNVDSMSICMSDNYVVWKNMMDMDLHGYDLSMREEFIVYPNDVVSTSISISGNYVVWRDMMDMDLHGYDLSMREEFIVYPNDVDSMSISISDNYVVWKDMMDMVLHGYDLSTREEFIVYPNDVDSTSIFISSNYVVWKDMIMMDMDFHGYDLSTREEFTITSHNVDSMSISISGNYVVWKNMMDIDFHGYDLSMREEFIVYPNDVDLTSIFISGNYVVWKDMMDMDLHGYDLSTREEFPITSNDVDSMSIFISGNYVVWKDMMDMDFHGARIYRIISDDCIDAVEVEDNVPYDGNTIRATGTDVTSCAYNDTIDVWHSYKPNVGGQVTISTDGSNFDTTLSVFNACGGDELACNDDYSLEHTQSEVTVSVVRGKTYFIRVAGFNGATGDYQLLVTRGACTEPIKSDLNHDCKVDLSDFAIFAFDWLECNLDPPELCWE
ncbi:MAG: hypothetical protein ACYS6W_10915 [Planctomycetota bacterium]